MNMQVSGFHNPQMSLIGGCIRGKRMQGNKSCGACEKGATVERDRHDLDSLFLISFVQSMRV
ncbi:hypothetical protein Z947_3586 [Sulfitobacter geojensis]|nr:hypothetical protein Z947_3586 [Sulfitobacter geojensis]